MPCIVRSPPVRRRIAHAVYSAVSACRGSEAIFSPHTQSRTQSGRMSEPLDLTVVGGQSAPPPCRSPLGSYRAVFAISGGEPHGLVLQRGSAEQHGLYLAAADVGGTLRAPSAGVLLGDDSERKD